MGYIEAADGSLTITDEADPAADLQKIADLVMKVGGVLKGTSAQRGAMTAGQLRDGWLFVETNTGFVYERVSGAWVRIAGGHVLTSFRTNNVINGVLEPLMVFGLAQGTTTAGGVLAHTFPGAFPTACIGVLLMPDNTSNIDGDGTPQLVAGQVSRTGFQSFWPRRGSANVAVAYVAFGY